MCESREWNGMLPTLLSSFIFRRIISLSYSSYAIQQVEPNLFPMLGNWQREYTMEDILLQLKKEMSSPHNRKLTQPPEGVQIFFCSILRIFLIFVSTYPIASYLVNELILLVLYKRVCACCDNNSGNEEARVDPKGIVLRCCVM